MNIAKHLPWLAPTVAIVAVGSGVLDRVQGVMGTGGQTPQAEQIATGPQGPALDTAESAAALAALAAVEAVDPIPEPATTATQLAALLEEDTSVDVTRQQGFATDTLTGVVEQAIAPEVAPQPVAQQGAVGADFFTAAQANLAQATSCENDLRMLASQARVYFPSGALTGEAAGIAQARLIGKIAERCQNVAVEVVGHSDASGNPAINLRLSQERAEAVVARIASAGVDTTKFTAIGIGSAQPSGITGREPAAFYDRRVEFVIVSLDGTLPAATTAAFVSNAELREVACVRTLQEAVDATFISYSPGSVTVSPEDMTAALGLAELAANCPQARLRIVGQFAEEFGTVEDVRTGRMRAMALMTTMVGQGYPSEQLIMAAPSCSQPVAGLPNGRVDFDVILENF